MAEYLIQDTTLTSLGNQVRTICDIKDTMSPSVMTNNLSIYNTDINTAIGEQDDLISQIITALENKATGSSVTVGEKTTTSSNPSITISDAIDKDNVAIMLMSSGNYQASAMADAGLGSVIVNGTSHSYTIMYTSQMYANSDDGFIEYNKSTGTISINSNMRYNETFIAGRYIYITW